MIEYGLGALESPFDKRDRPVEMLYAAEGVEPLAVLPAKFYLGALPPNLNQKDTPQCVAFSSSGVKAWQDRKDQGQFFDFDEAKFFKLIGGGSNGAYIRNAMARMKNYGYPVWLWGMERLHKIDSYYSVPISADMIKNTVLHFGPVLIGSKWYSTWFHPNSNGVLPAPKSYVGGHATYIYGWNPEGFYVRNSWGREWGAFGNFILPYKYLSEVFEAWKSMDKIETAF